jgi:hypothetical protein
MAQATSSAVATLLLAAFYARYMASWAALISSSKDPHPLRERRYAYGETVTCRG